MSRDELEVLKQRAQLYVSKSVDAMLIAPHDLLNLLEDFETLDDQLKDSESQLMDQYDLQERADEAKELEKDLAHAENQIDEMQSQLNDLQRDNQVMSKALAACRCGGET